LKLLLLLLPRFPFLEVKDNETNRKSKAKEAALVEKRKRKRKVRALILR